MRVPRALTTAGLRDRFGDPDAIDPAVGQIRRAEWADVARLVLLIAVDDRRWRVVPVSIEPRGEDEDSLVVGPSRSTFPVEVTAWAGLIKAIPTGALGRLVDVWEPELVAWCAVTTDARVQAPAGTRVGGPVDRYASGHAVRADISDDLDMLASTPLVPVRAEASVDLKAATYRVGLRAVMDALALPQSTVMKIVQGRQAVSESQGARLAEVFGCTVADVLAATSGLPANLAAELELPRWRAVWRFIAGRLDISEDAARLMAGAGAAAPAYRQTGGASPTWRGRVEQWVTANGYYSVGTADGE
jgi:hypothetical protein